MSPNFSDAFSELAAANADLSTAMHARYMIRRFRSMGILAEYIEHKGEFSHIFIPANDGAYLKIRPARIEVCLLYTSPSPRDGLLSRMPSSA